MNPISDQESSSTSARDIELSWNPPKLQHEEIYGLCLILIEAIVLVGAHLIDNLHHIVDLTLLKL